MNLIERVAERAASGRGADLIDRPINFARDSDVVRADGRRPLRASGSSYPVPPSPCRIFRPSRSAMQSGTANTRRWLLEFEPVRPKWIEPLMGWTASDDPFVQIRLTFPTKETAVAYAEREGLDYRVIEPPAPHIRPKTYRSAIWTSSRPANAKGD